MAQNSSAVARRAAFFFFGASALAMAPAAFAQDEAGEAVSTPDIVVTGSRIVSNGNSSPVPVTVVSSETLRATNSGTLTESLNVLPIFSGSRTLSSNASVTGGVGGGNGVAAQLNLRNIGANRTLVLIDGLRVPPTTTNGIVDADMIPEALIQRVDVVTGGVSAVYGSDAVSGVVNFIVDRNFNGVKGRFQTGFTEYGDGMTQNAAIAVGFKVGDRGHFEFSYEYRDDEGVNRKSARDWFTRPGVVGAGTTASPFTLLENLTLSNLPFGGRILSGAGALNGQYFAQNGVLSPFVNGTATATSGTQVGGAGGYDDFALRAKLRSHQIFGRFDYDLTDDLHAYVMASGNLKKNNAYTGFVRLNNVMLSNGNAFLPDQYASQLATGGSFRYGQIIQDYDSRYNPRVDSTQWMFVGGLEGKLGDARWNLSYTYGRNKLKTTLGNNVNNQKLAAALDAVRDPVTGNIVCNASLTNPTAYSGCAPLNPFGPTAASQAALDYITEDNTFVGLTQQHDVIGSISAPIFELPAGPVELALSGEYRKQSFSNTSEATPVAADCTGLRYNCSATTLRYQTSFPENPGVSLGVWESALELNVPVLRDSALADSLVLNGALRYTKYDTVGSYWTWKAGAVWQFNDAITMRGTISRDIRAPTLGDLYEPTQVTTVTNTDLLTGLSNQITSYTLGNPNLRAEIGSTKTVGIVVKPTNGLSLAVDYYNIKVSNAITRTPGFTSELQQSCYTSGGTSPYCALQDRPINYTDTSAANAVTAWYTTVINISEIKTQGFDFELNYNTEIAGQPFSFRGFAAWQPDIKYIQPAVPTVDQAGVAFGNSGIVAAPKWRLTGMIGYAPADWLKLDFQYRWRSGLKYWGSGVWTDNHIPTYGVAALNVAIRPKQQVAKDLEVFFNVQNLFDRDPVVANASNTANAPGGNNGFVLFDDVLGRSYTAGVRFRF